MFDPEELFYNSIPGGIFNVLHDGIYCDLCKCQIKEEAWRSHCSEELHVSSTAALHQVKASERMLHARRNEAIAWKLRI
jgi:hypothetical protein